MTIIKIDKDVLFISTFLIFLFTILNLILQNQLKDSYNIYPVLLAIALLFNFLTVFTFSFKILLFTLKEKKNLLFIANIFLTIVQFWFLYQSVLSLNQTSYIYESTKFIFLSNILFYAQSLLDKSLQIKKIILTTLITEFLFVIILFIRPNFLINSSRLILLTQQFISLCILIYAFLLLIKVLTFFNQQNKV